MTIVRVKWRDAHAYQGWTLPNRNDPYTVDICESAGWLISKNDNCLVMALDLDMNGNYGSVSVIPAEVITEYEVIRE